MMAEAGLKQRGYGEEKYLKNVGRFFKRIDFSVRKLFIKVVNNYEFCIAGNAY